MSSAYSPSDEPLNILYDDHQIVVVDKPAGLLSVPGRGPHLADCLITRVQAVFPSALLVHRLDRDTSGVMVFALSAHAQRHISLQFEQRKTQKTYIALVAGQVQDKTGIVDLPLIVDWPNRPRQMVCHETGKPAVTEWQVIRAKDTETRLRLKPKTRTLASIARALFGAWSSDFRRSVLRQRRRGRISADDAAFGRASPQTP